MVLLVVNTSFADSQKKIIGYWKVDVEATARTPECKKIMKDKDKRDGFGMKLFFGSKFQIGFTKTEYIAGFSYKYEKGKESFKENKIKYKVIESGKEEITIKAGKELIKIKIINDDQFMMIDRDFKVPVLFKRSKPYLEEVPMDKDKIKVLQE